MCDIKSCCFHTSPLTPWPTQTLPLLTHCNTAGLHSWLTAHVLHLMHVLYEQQQHLYLQCFDNAVRDSPTPRAVALHSPPLYLANGRQLCRDMDDVQRLPVLLHRHCPAVRQAHRKRFPARGALPEAVTRAGPLHTLQGRRPQMRSSAAVRWCPEMVQEAIALHTFDCVPALPSPC
jgi:hypothetical protein